MNKVEQQLDVADVDASTLKNQKMEEKKVNNNNNHSISMTGDMIAGFGAGAVAVCVGYPLDVLKTRIQTTSVRRQLPQPQQRLSVFQTGRNIIQKEGALSLYKGLASPLVTLSVSSSIGFTSYAFFKGLYNPHDAVGWHSGNFLAGMSCGPISGIISTAENHIRTQMQIDNVHKKRFKNSFHCVKNIIRYHGGIRTLFKGWTVTTMKDSVYLSSYFFVYEGVKGTILSQHQQKIGKEGGLLANNNSNFIYSQAAAIPIAGGMAGVTAWFMAYPLDCIRAGVHGRTLDNYYKNKYKRGISGWQVFQKILQTQGFKGFFNGVIPTLFRASLVHSVRFSAYEAFLWLFRTTAVSTTSSLHHHHHHTTLKPTPPPPVVLMPTSAGRS